MHINNILGTIVSMRMRHEPEVKKRAKELRSQGKTYSEIMKILAITVPKSTLSSWCDDVKLPASYQERVDKLNHKNLSRGRKIAYIANKIKRENLFRDLRKQNEHLARELQKADMRKVALAMLYLGEGSKWKSHRGLMLGNSDPTIIRLYIKLLRLCYGITAVQMKCRISYRADQDIKKLEQYWSHVTKIPLKNFYKTIPDPRTVGKPTKRTDYKGVCVITYGSTKIQLELEMIPKILLEGPIAQW